MHLNRRAPLSDSEQHERYFGTRANLHSLTFSPAHDLLETPLPMDTIAVAQLPMPTITPLDTDATRSAYRACGVGLRGHTSSPAYEASWHASEDATPATSSKAAFAHIVVTPRARSGKGVMVTTGETVTLCLGVTEGKGK